MRVQPWLSVLLALGLSQSSSALGGQTDDDPTVSSSSLQQILEAQGQPPAVVDDVHSNKNCQRCQAALLSLKSIAALGDRAFINAVTRSCIISKTEDAEVCRGAMELEGPILAEAIRHMAIGSKTAKLFCVGLLGECDYPDIDEWVVPFPSEKPNGGRPSPSGRDPIKVIHHSDIHIDPFYVEGSRTDCGKPICCRPYTEADEPGNNTSPAGPYGDHHCDVPAPLEASMYAAMKELVPDVSFAMFTGDIVDHAVWATTQPSNEQRISEAYNNMADTLGLVYGTAGNHEAHPTNAYQPNSVGDAAQWIYNLLSEQWSRWISQEESSDTEKLGMYSAKYPNGNLRIISLNTNMYYRQNFWLYQRDMIRDPNDYLAWLVKELDAAEKAGENVYLIGHMSVGDKNTFHDASNYLDQIINRYSATIAAMFFGHTHRDEFQISYSDYKQRTFSNALVTSYIGASLTPTSGMPSFRVYDVDPVTFGVLDITVYSADMTKDAFQKTGPVWQKFYSAKEAYGAAVHPPVTDARTELTAAFWHNVTEAMERDSRVFDAFLLRKSRGWFRPDCAGECKTNEICQLRAARSQDNCRRPVESINSKETTEGHEETHGECGYSIAGAALGSLLENEALLAELEASYREEL